MRRCHLPVLLSVTVCVCTLSAQEIANEPRRETWQRVPDLFRAMRVHEGAVVADVGAGEGFLTVRLSPRVGNGGKVYAVESDVIILNAYHEMPQGVTMLRHIRDAMKPGAALVLCEPAPATTGQTRSAQLENHVLETRLIADDLQEAGFQIVDRQEQFATNLGGTHFSLVVARRP